MGGQVREQSSSTARPMPLLQVSDLRVEIATRRGVVRAVDGVSLEVPAGEAVGLVGESGSGKSMTLRAILGVLPPEARVTAGQIMLDGVDLAQLSNAQLNKIRGPKIAMIFQEPMSALNPVMRVGQQIAEGPAGAPRHEQGAVGGAGPGAHAARRHPRPRAQVPLVPA